MTYLTINEGGPYNQNQGMYIIKQSSYVSVKSQGEIIFFSRSGNFEVCQGKLVCQQKSGKNQGILKWQASNIYCDRKKMTVIFAAEFNNSKISLSDYN